MAANDPMDPRGEPKVTAFFDGLSGVARYIRMYFGETRQHLANGTCFRDV